MKPCVLEKHNKYLKSKSLFSDQYCFMLCLDHKHALALEYTMYNL